MHVLLLFCACILHAAGHLSSLLSPLLNHCAMPTCRCLLVVKELVDFEKDEEVQRKLVNATNKLSVTALRLAVDKERTSVSIPYTVTVLCL